MYACASSNLASSCVPHDHLMHVYGKKDANLPDIGLPAINVHMHAYPHVHDETHSNSIDIYNTSAIL